jgi:tRNA(Ile)-lysidine synthase
MLEPDLRAPLAPPALLDAVAAVLDRHGSERPLLVAVSGGADSTALAWLLAALRDRARLAAAGLLLAHCDHRQHPSSAAAAAQVRALAAGLRCRFVGRVLDLPPAASEARMRAARYAALRALALDAGADRIATAHHRDDQVETVLLRAERGTGRRGLAGIPTRRGLGAGVAVIRPLLEVPRRELRGLLRACGLSWFEDPSNRSLGPRRNHLRHAVLPTLRATGPVDEAIAAAARAIRTETVAVEAAARSWIGSAARRTGPGRIELEVPPGDLAREVLRLLHAALLDRAPLGAWLDAAVSLLGRPPGSLLQNDLDAERTRSGLLLVDPRRRGQAPSSPVRVRVDGAARRFGSTHHLLRATEVGPELPAPDPHRRRAVFDPARARPPFHLRTASGSERFDAPGLGLRPLGDLLQARGVPRGDRTGLPLLVDAEDRIVWAPGLDLAAFARLGGATRSAILVEQLRPQRGGVDLPEPSY